MIIHNRVSGVFSVTFGLLRPCLLIAVVLSTFLAQRWMPASAGETVSAAGEFAWRESPASLALICGQQVVWQFNHLQDGSQRGVPYFHPLATLNGAVLTDLRPDDHLWHRGLRFAWKQINGLDGYWTWPEGLERFPEATGQTDVTAVRMTKGKDFSARFELELSYHPPGQPADLTEKRTILVSAPDAQGRYRIDWQGVFTVGARGAVLDRTPLPSQPDGKPWGGYAGLQLRLPQRANLAAWSLLNSEKLAASSSPNTVDKGSASGLQELHGQDARWLEVSMELVDGKKGAVALFDHPGNLRHPSAWHVSSMPNELIQTPLFHGPHTLAAGESLTFTYRILVSSERSEAGFLDQQWQDFAGTTSATFIETSAAFIETEEKSDWTSLFDGKTLAGWKASENPKSFSVRDGMIVARAIGDSVKEQAPHPKCHLFFVGPDGDASFTNFEFQTEVKVEPGANSGIYFHTEFVEKNWPQKGFEVQINNTYKDPRKTGSLYAVADVAEPVAKDDEWFTLWIRVEGKHVQIKINDKLVVDWTEPEDFVSRKPPWWSERRLSHGTFALQAHDDQSVVYFRNLKVRPLDERPPGEAWVNPPQEAIPGVEHRTFRSASMQRDVGFNLYLPPGYADSENRFPVAYYLHGMTDCESTHPQLFAILDQAIRAGEVPPMILVYAMCGRTSFYADSPDGDVMGETVFVKELIPHVDSTVRTVASRDGRAVLGFSMGGAGAVKFACRYPDLFSSAVALSGGYAPGEVERSRFPKAIQQMFGDDVKRFDEQSALTLVRTVGTTVPLRVVVGTKDVLYQQNQELKTALEAAKIGFEYEEIEDVAHNPPLVFAAQGLKAFQFHARHFRPDAAAKNASGPLRAHPTNPRYFTDGSGRAIYLAGWNVWSNLQDGYGSGWEHGWGSRFDYDAYLEDLVGNNLNYIRLWLYETAKVAYPGSQSKGTSPDIPTPNPWQRTGPGTAADGGLKFDLTQFNPAYFDLLRSRVLAAGKRGIYVSIMLFEGFSIRNDAEHQAYPWHPFNATNNTNGVNGDPHGGGQGTELHTLKTPAITELQEAYVRAVIDSVNDLDNVIYEIANESRGSAKWQYHLIQFIKAYEARKPKQHPIQMSAAGAITNEHLNDSPADAIGPARKGSRVDYVMNPPAADGKHVVITDTDHFGWNRFRNDPTKGRAWAWKNFTRGNNASLLVPIPDKSGWSEARRALGDTRTFAIRINLAAMTPHNDLASSRFCLAAPGREYLVYLPAGGGVTVDLSQGKGMFAVEWFNPRTGTVTNGGPVEGGAKAVLKTPFEGDAVVYLLTKEGVKR